MEEIDQGLSHVRDATLARFAASGLHQFFIFYSPSKDVFVAHVFFTSADIQKRAKANDVIEKIENLTRAELQKAGRGVEGHFQILFHIDNDENVQRNYGGDYFLRLR